MSSAIIKATPKEEKATPVYFSCGKNVIGIHVDAIMTSNGAYPVYVRAATNEEILEHCLPHVVAH